MSISYTGAANPPTADKPESKLWWNDGSWWADMWTSGSGWHIYKLDRASKKWVDTGVPIDTRANTLADTLWDGTHLYIASHVVTASSETVTEPSLPNQPAKLYRYSYANGTYKLDSGFPATIATKSSESMTIDKDSTGVVWATWTEVNATATGSYTSSVMVNNSGPDGASWGTPFVLPVNNVHPAVDDISAVVAFNKKQIGVMWSDQTTGSVWWATRTDGTAATSWKSQPAVQGKGIADDHLNLKSLQADTAGRVYAAVKTSLDETTTDMTQPQLQLLVFKPGTGAFSKSTISTLADCQTRPQIVLDPDNNKIHAFQTGPSTNVSGCPYAGVSGSIYEKTADMDNPVFGSGRGTPIIQNGSSATVNNPTTTKQPVTSTSGIVVLASDDAAKRYWFADLPVGSPKTATAPGTFVPIAPTRFLDTRSTAPVPANTTLSFQVAGTAGIPDKVSAVVFNLTVTQPQKEGHIRAYPSGSTVPTTSNVNFVANQTVPNSVTVPVGKDGKVTLLNSSWGSTHLIADVNGYYIAGTPALAGAFTPVGPERVLDTRTSAPLAANSALSFQVAGASGIPRDASAVVFNLTVTQPQDFGHIRSYPSGSAVPATSSVNFSPNQTVPNSVTVPIGADGKVTLQNSSNGTAQLIVDINGYYLGGTPTAVGTFVPYGPSRFVDTRNTTPVGPDSALSFQVAGVTGIPSKISAAVFNLTVTQPQAPGHIRAYPAGGTVPDTSNANFSFNETVANSVTAPVGVDGKISLLNSSAGSTQLIADVGGFFLGG
ncbi:MULTISPECIES: hypothetical protein [unclassified Arthrobacter]|uniref:hypothetical protein n=1 Tax=unclassified Arthrobacter TaxID=235627 RepID=UPI001C8436C7|nr:hypothetical protein [Arthrobacter sp. MAHUQ-56]MBX7445449.1 hypothetical protein [Arthrobacter sp. MAHUQ-56]